MNLGYNMFEIKDDSKYQWTNHVKEKMMYYRLSPSLVKRVVRFPNRVEEGVAPKTVAVMQSRKSISRAKGKEGKKVEEIWVMYQSVGQRPTDKSEIQNLNFQIDSNKKRIISAWRYPGESPIGKKIPIPDDILAELESGTIA